MCNYLNANVKLFSKGIAEYKKNIYNSLKILKVIRGSIFFIFIVEMWNFSINWISEMTPTICHSFDNQWSCSQTHAI